MILIRWMRWTRWQCCVSINIKFFQMNEFVWLGDVVSPPEKNSVPKLLTTREKNLDSSSFVSWIFFSSSNGDDEEVVKNRDSHSSVIVFWRGKKNWFCSSSWRLLVPSCFEALCLVRWHSTWRQKQNGDYVRQETRLTQRTRLRISDLTFSRLYLHFPSSAHFSVVFELQKLIWKYRVSCPCGIQTVL